MKLFHILPLQVCILCCFIPLFAEPLRASAQAHSGAVNVLLPDKHTPDSFFSAGSDGTVTKWEKDGMGTHYQIGDLPITALCQNPQNNDIAILESNGTSHKVTVLDWETCIQKYSKQFPSPVLTISYSEKGTYLFISTKAVNGTYMLDAHTGTVLSQMTDIPSGISTIQTGASEKSAILYSTAGTICYYDLVNGKKISTANFSTEPYLEQTLLSGAGSLKNRFLMGTKNGTLFVIDAMSGKTLATYTAKNALLFLPQADPSVGLYVLSKNERAKTYTLSLLENDTLEAVLKAPSLRRTELTALQTVSIAQQGGDISSIIQGMQGIVLGTKSGSIYTLDKENTTQELTQQMYDPIYDVASFNNTVYVLTKNTIYTSSYDKKSIKSLGKNSGHTNLLMYDSNTALLWSKGTKKPVQSIHLNAQSNVANTLFLPNADIASLKVFGTALVSVQGQSVYMYDMRTQKSVCVYTGLSVEDAILVDPHTLYIAKASSGTNDSALIMLNVQTEETVPLPVDGFAAYSLSYDAQNTSRVYGIILKDFGGTTVTEVFAYSPKTARTETICTFNQEDTRAFTQLHFPNVYTNLGKNQIYAYNEEQNHIRMYRRTASLPVKMAFTKDRIVFLNTDGSLSWYNPALQMPLADWYMTQEGEWFEW